MERHLKVFKVCVWNIQATQDMYISAYSSNFDLVFMLINNLYPDMKMEMYLKEL